MKRLLHPSRFSTGGRRESRTDWLLVTSKTSVLWYRFRMPGRFYDFVVFTEHKRAEKLCYMHQNPVKRGLVVEPQQWAWSSFRHYEYGERGAVLVNEPQRAKLHVREIA